MDAVETYLTDYTCSVFRQGDGAVPKPRVESVLRACDGDGVRPGISSQDCGQRRVVDFGEFCRGADGGSGKGFFEVEGVNSDGFVGGVSQGAVRPLGGQLVRFWSLVSSHSSRLPYSCPWALVEVRSGVQWHADVRNYAQKDVYHAVQKYNPTTIPPLAWETIKPFVTEAVTDYRTRNPIHQETTDVVTTTAHLTYWATTIAGYYHREGDHNGDKYPADSRYATRYKRQKEIHVWAYEAHTAVMFSDDAPNLVMSISFDKPGTQLEHNALVTLDALAGKNFTPGHLVTDRAYFPGLKPAALIIPATQRGFKPVYDYKNTMLGKTASYQGAILVEGKWYSPLMPQKLIDASRDYLMRSGKDPHAISGQEYMSRIKERTRYQLKTKQSLDADGYARYSCPALGKDPSVKCKLRLDDMRREALDRPIPMAPLLLSIKNEPLQPICTQKSITIPLDAGAKYLQEYPYKSEAWQRYYTQGRQTVESINASLKKGAFLPIDDSELCPRRGWAAQLVSVTMSIVSTNIRLIASWAKKQERDEKISALPSRRVRRRRAVTGWDVPVGRMNDPPLVVESPKVA